MFDVRGLNIAIEFWGVAFCIFGILCTLLFSQVSKAYHSLVLQGFAFEMIACAGDAVAGIYRGQEGDFTWLCTHAGNLATFIGSFLLIYVLTAYLARRIEDSCDDDMRTWLRIVNLAITALCVLTACGAFYTIDAANVYHRTSWYPASLASVILINAVNAALATRRRKELGALSYSCLMFYSLSPLVAALIQMLVYGLNFTIITGLINMVVIFFETRAYSARLLVERTEQLAKARIEVSESRIQVMVSQIQPHFIFNSLDTIYGLVDEDPELAKSAIASFSRYLRANLDSLKHAEPVPISREMEHVQTYLELERLSDEGRLSYELDVAATGFSVPTLSVQTLVENAVKHGIGRREQGGHITIRTRELPQEFTVAVIDDGVGFDSQAKLGSGTHIGLANTRQRLDAMCGGWLEVTSKPGEGTTVIMHIPKDAKGRAS